jgi:hypothetical protein
MQIFDYTKKAELPSVGYRMNSQLLEQCVTAEKPIASLLEISRILEETARILKQHASCASIGEDASGRAELVTAPLVRAVIACRRMRRNYFPDISGDPTWGMMLELYAAGLEGRRLGQTLLGTLAGVSETTALRLTRNLLQQGTFTRHDDPEDRRAVLLGLSEGASSHMRAYLIATIAAGPLPA